MFKPFEHGTESCAIDDLTIENQLDRVNIYGNLQITKDRHGLKSAKALQILLGEVIKSLEAHQPLPDQIVRPQEKEIDNPFL